jgi:hypothetical protein
MFVALLQTNLESSQLGLEELEDECTSGIASFLGFHVSFLLE